jgi:hypothetical protein
MRLMVEVEGAGPGPALPGDGAALVAFMSFCVVRGFGAQHPYIALADRLHAEHRVRMGPLTTFYEGTIEDVEDMEKLELAWQDAPALRESLEAVVTAFDGDPQVTALARRAAADGLRDQVACLLEMVRAAEGQGARVRLSYTL